MPGGERLAAIRFAEELEAGTDVAAIRLSRVRNCVGVRESDIEYGRIFISQRKAQISERESLLKSDG